MCNKRQGIKPLDHRMLNDMASRINRWITLEDSLIQGGLEAASANLLRRIAFRLR